MNAFQIWKGKHPDLWEFILFNILSNCATVTNFIVMWLGTGLLFTGLSDQPFQFLFFRYTMPESLGLCGFLSFLAATAAAQTVNFFVQKYWVFRSNAAFQKAVPRYILLAVVLVVVSSALPAYSQELFIRIGISEGLAPTLANILNILLQVVISYPAMKFFIMKKE